MTQQDYWREWFEQHGSRLMLFARQQARRSADGEDVLQEAFIRMWKSRPNVEDWDLPLMFRMIRNTAIDFARSEDSRRKREDKVIEWAGVDIYWFDRTVEKDERRKEIEDAVKTLSEPQQEVLVLKIWGEQTFDEIGEILGVSQNTAASRYRYAIENLKKKLEELKNAGSGE